jgi:hypothetical protein
VPIIKPAQEQKYTRKTIQIHKKRNNKEAKNNKCSNVKKAAIKIKY